MEHKCPECGGPAIQRPEALGGLFCEHCGVIDQDRLVEIAHDMLKAHTGMIPGEPLKISKEEIWAELSKQLIDLQ